MWGNPSTTEEKGACGGRVVVPNPTKGRGFGLNRLGKKGALCLWRRNFMKGTENYCRGQAHTKRKIISWGSGMKKI